MFPGLLTFLVKVVPAVLIIYAIGFALAFITSFFSIVIRLFYFNSLRAKNFRLILVKETILGVTLEIVVPEYPSIKNVLKEFCISVGLILISSLLSWIQVLIYMYSYIKNFIGWILMPSAVRAHRWKLNNIEFQRAEDLLESFRKEGFMPKSDLIWNKQIKDLSDKSIRLAEEYASTVYNGDKEKIQEYVENASRITKEIYDSVVIHPRFWAISPDEYSANAVIGVKYDYD